MERRRDEVKGGELWVHLLREHVSVPDARGGGQDVTRIATFHQVNNSCH